MDSFWLEAAKQAPALVVLCWLVTYFFKHLRHRDESLEKLTSGVIDALEKNSEAIGRFEALLEKFNGAAKT